MATERMTQPVTSTHLDPVQRDTLKRRCVRAAFRIGNELAMDYIRKTYGVASGRAMDLSDSQLIAFAIWLFGVEEANASRQPDTKNGGKPQQGKLL